MQGYDKIREEMLEACALLDALVTSLRYVDDIPNNPLATPHGMTVLAGALVALIKDLTGRPTADLLFEIWSISTLTDPLCGGETPPEHMRAATAELTPRRVRYQTALLRHARDTL
jgi:hypothetical protein